MIQLFDNQNRKWSTQAVTDKMGRTYIRAYRNEWDKVKKQSKTAAKIMIGRLQKDGSITVSNGAVAETFHSIDTTDLYWKERQLLTKQEYLEEFGEVASNTTDISWSCDAIHVGSTWALSVIAQEEGVTQDLEKVFGKNLAQFLLAFSAYCLECQGTPAMSRFDNWVHANWFPDTAPLAGQRVSELLAGIDQTKIFEYFQLRYDRRYKANENGHLMLSFDSTSISTYSESIEDAAFGHAKQNPELKQINYMQVCDHETGDVVFASSYEGSVNDKAALPTIYEQMQSVGIDLKGNILVTDRGFQSIYNTLLQLQKDFKYIQFLSITEGATATALKRNSHALRAGMLVRHPDLGVNALTVKDHWSYLTDGGTKQKVDAWLHLYIDADLALQRTDRLTKKAYRVVDAMNKYEAQVQKAHEERRAKIEQVRKAKGDEVAKSLEETLKVKMPARPGLDQDFKDVARYIHENRRAKAGGLIWSVDAQKLKEFSELAGVQAIRTNAESDPYKALAAYRERNIIEEGFRQLKNEASDGRLMATETSYRGKLLCYTIAQSLRMMLFIRLDKSKKENPGLKLPGDSLLKTFDQLRNLQATKHKTTDAFIVKPVPKKNRDIYEALKISQPPSTFYRFSKCATRRAGG